MGYVRTFLLWVCLLDISYTVLSGKPEKHVDVTKIWAGMRMCEQMCTQRCKLQLISIIFQFCKYFDTSTYFTTTYILRKSGITIFIFCNVSFVVRM